MQCLWCTRSFEPMSLSIQYKIGKKLVLCENCFISWKSEQLDKLKLGESDKGSKKNPISKDNKNDPNKLCKICPGCQKTYDSSWKVCLDCRVELLDNEQLK